MTDEGRMVEIPDGSITSPLGISAAGIASGLRKEPGRLDLALVKADQPCTAAATFTTNVFCAAPVDVSREHLDGVGYGTARAIIINSGTANAATGDIGLENARRSAQIVADAVGCPASEVLVASTGVIGVHLDTEPFVKYVPALHAALDDDAEGGHQAARAIMTTDTVPKECAVSYTSEDSSLEGARITVGGCCKGAGMIMPNMATMIAIVTTDAAVEPRAAHALLQEAVGRSFNKVTIDSDTSTNDTCFFLASGRAAPDAQPIAQGSTAYDELAAAVGMVCETLARKIAADGEGATKLVTVQVRGAADAAQADMAARTIANSPLVKTAIAGHDANWGRIAAAAGRSGAAFRQEDVDIDIMGMPVLRAGLPVPFSEDEALARFEEPEIVIEVDLGAGSAQTVIWTCDFTHEYVSINGDYRS